MPTDNAVTVHYDELIGWSVPLTDHATTEQITRQCMPRLALREDRFVDFTLIDQYGRALPPGDALAAGLTPGATAWITHTPRADSPYAPRAHRCPRCSASQHPIELGHSHTAHRLYAVLEDNGIRTRAHLRTLTDKDFLGMRYTGAASLELLRRFVSEPDPADPAAIRKAYALLAELDLKGTDPDERAAVRRALAESLGRDAFESLLTVRNFIDAHAPQLTERLGPEALPALVEVAFHYIAVAAHRYANTRELAAATP